MTPEEIQDRLRHEGDVWLERQRANAAIAQADARHARGSTVTTLVVVGLLGLLVVGGVVWGVTR